MIRPRVLLAAGLIAASCLAGPQAIPGVRGAGSLPSALTDQEFWKIATEFSEADGYFRSDNLLSNELTYPSILSALVNTAPAARVYMGVGPEQNFNYIAVLRPTMAFIIDIRRGNRNLQLLYKALFELSSDRAEFVSKLFSRRRPEGLGAASTPSQIFSAFHIVDASEDLYRQNLRAVTDALTETHHFDLSSGDLNGIESVYGAFKAFGPDIRYSSTQGGGGGFGGFNQPSYADLMRATGADGRPSSYLATEQSFRVWCRPSTSRTSRCASTSRACGTISAGMWPPCRWTKGAHSSGQPAAAATGAGSG